ncbi:MAG: ParB/RepB/Spo0J family partition protein [Alphaproteobacteria bacterium]|nr:ParB/RepB/Spo0J family partition protein [Alphaproteobacteria bacterium]
MLEETKDNKKKSLGRGLEALLGEMNDSLLDDELSTVKTDNITVAIKDIFVSPLQPRKEFDADAIKALAASIKEKGVLQPLIVRRSTSQGGYELIAGERRLRASKEAGLSEVPVIIKELSDSEVLEIALVENLLRENLSPIEEADAYQKLIDNFSHTQEKIAEIVGKSRSYIANTLRLLTLPAEVKNYIGEGKLSAGHARCLVGLDNAVNLADKIIKDDLNVRQVEALVAKQKDDSTSGREPKKAQTKDRDIADIEAQLNRNLGLRIKISSNSQGGGKVVMQYSSLAELDMIVSVLNGKKELNLAPQKNQENNVFKLNEKNEIVTDKFLIKYVE